jgi:hypothetical protein
VAVDVDTDDPAVLEKVADVLSPNCPRKKGSKGETFFVRAEVPQKLKLPVGFATVNGQWTVTYIEVLTHGQQTVIPPSLHPSTMQPYEWLTGRDGIARTLYTVALHELPRVDGCLEAAFRCALEGLVVPQELVEACEVIAKTTEGERNDTFNREVFKLARGEVAIPLQLGRRWLTAAAKHAGLNAEEIANTFDSALRGAEEQRRTREGQSQHEPTLVTVCAADVEPKPVAWLWPRRIAKGKPSLLAGEPGASKSQLAIAVGAVVSTGGDWPCREGKAPLGTVVILSAEDSTEDTVVPRLMAAGADLTRVHLIEAVRTKNGERGFNLKKDLGALEAKITDLGDVALVIVDPITGYMGDAESNSTTAVRAVLDPLGQMAEHLGVAVLVVHHFRKQSGDGPAGKPSHRILGSQAFVAAARVAFLVVEDPETPGRRLFLNCKPPSTELPPPGLAYALKEKQVRPEITASYVAWEDQPVATSADEFFAEVTKTTATLTTRAAILDLIVEKGGLTPKEVADELGLRHDTVKQCMSRLARAGKLRREGGRYWPPDRQQANSGSAAGEA